MLVLPALAVLAATLLVFAPSVYATSNYEIMTSDHTFVDSAGMTNVVGVLDNKGDTPFQATLGLNVVDKDGQTKVLKAEPYGRVLFPSKGAPFKFAVEPESRVVGKPYILSIEEVNQPYFDTLVFTYTNMAVGEEKMLIGTVRNDGPFEIRNLSVFASVHDENTVQLDSARSNVIPVLKPGEEATFTAMPDPAIKSQVYYYSCAGFDADSPITTLPVGDGQFIPYDFQSVAKVSSLRYDNTTDSIMFGIKHYNPNGGPASLKIPQMFENQTVTVIMDGKPYDKTTVTMDGRTVHLEFFVPSGDHQVQVQGVRTIPEFPFAILCLASVTAVAIALARFKAAFKIS